MNLKLVTLAVMSFLCRMVEAAGWNERQYQSFGIALKEIAIDLTWAGGLLFGGILGAGLIVLSAPIRLLIGLLFVVLTLARSGLKFLHPG